MSNEKLTMRLAGGAVVTFTSKEQKERFIKITFTTELLYTVLMRYRKQGTAITSQVRRYQRK